MDNDNNLSGHDYYNSIRLVTSSLLAYKTKEMLISTINNMMIKCLNPPNESKGEIQKRYYQKNKKLLVKKSRMYYQKNKVLALKLQKIWREENPNKVKASAKRFYQKHKEEIVKRNKKIRRDIKLKVLQHYGLYCACCGETIFEFLTIDHINNDGAKHRRLIGEGTKFYNWLIKNNFPKGLQTLCWNCNTTKGFFGCCPHQSVQSTITPQLKHFNSQ